MSLVIPERHAQHEKVTPERVDRFARQLIDRSRRLTDENVSPTAAIGITKRTHQRGLQALAYTSPSCLSMNHWGDDMFTFTQPSAGEIVGVSFYVRNTADWTGGGGIQVGIFESGVLLAGTDFTYVPATHGGSRYEAMGIALSAAGGKGIRARIDPVATPGAGTVDSANFVSNGWCGFIVWLTAQFVNQ